MFKYLNVRNLNIQLFFFLCNFLSKIINRTQVITSIPANSWWAIGYLIIFGSVLTFIAFMYALQRLPPELNSIYAYINPIVAVLLGAVIFGEPLSLAIAIGGSITLGGLYLVNYSIRKGKV